MNLLWRVGRPLFFLLKAEVAHRLAQLVMKKAGAHLLQILSGPQAVQTRVWDMDFINPVGLAAGFDKNAEWLPLLPGLGFGFAEVGTVTPHAQPGNEQPRLFRDTQTRALFNRMGFNNDGMEVIYERINDAKPHLPQGFRVGINFGKNKSTPLEDAWKDYETLARRLGALADFIVINVSSPNTPELRKLQQPEHLRTVLSSVLNALPTPKPVLIKFAPEFQREVFESAVHSAEGAGASGFVLTNTMAGNREGQDGGWSGGPLTASSREILSWARACTPLPIISVGGIMDVQEAKTRFEMGANLIEIYSGWIFEGPQFPGAIARALKGLKTQKPRSF